VPLSEDGRSEVLAGAAELAEKNPTIAALYAGPCRSAQETAEMLAARLKLKPKTIDALQNLNQGLWQGLLFDDVKSKQPKVYRQWQEKPETVCPPEGETLQSSRALKALAKLVKAQGRGTIAVVWASRWRRAAMLNGTARVAPGVAKSPLWQPLEVPSAE
jgi:probable phosphoglycerate mutase